MTDLNWRCWLLLAAACCLFCPLISSLCLSSVACRRCLRVGRSVERQAGSRRGRGRQQTAKTVAQVRTGSEEESCNGEERTRTRIRLQSTPTTLRYQFRGSSPRQDRHLRASAVHSRTAKGCPPPRSGSASGIRRMMDSQEEQEQEQGRTMLQLLQNRTNSQSWRVRPMAKTLHHLPPPPLLQRMARTHQPQL